MSKNTGQTISEHEHQKKVIAWAEIMSIQIPGLELLFAIPNGGHRYKAVAAKLKAEGVKKGVPDLCLPVARGLFHGLYIEMKQLEPRGYPKKDQKWWLKKLSKQGYATYCCRGHKAAISVIQDYLNQAAI